MAEIKNTTAKIETKGDAFVVTAGFKAEDIKNLVKYGMSSALQLVDKDTKDIMFKVSMGDHAEYSKFGVTFTGANKNGYAELTCTFPKTSMSDDEKRAYLRDGFAHIIANLEKVQEQISAKTDELTKLIGTVNGAIKID